MFQTESELVDYFEERIKTIGETVHWARGKIEQLSKVTHDPFTRRNLLAIAPSLNPDTNPKLKEALLGNGDEEEVEEPKAEVHEEATGEVG